MLFIGCISICTFDNTLFHLSNSNFQMPYAQKKERSARKERYLRQTTSSPVHSIPNSPLQGSVLNSEGNKSPSSNVPPIRTGTPRPRIGSVSSDTPAKKRRGRPPKYSSGQSEDNLDDLTWTPCTRGRPQHAISPEKAALSQDNCEISIKKNTFLNLPSIQIGSPSSLIQQNITEPKKARGSPRKTNSSRESTPDNVFTTPNLGGRPYKNVKSAGRRKYLADISLIDSSQSETASQLSSCEDITMEIDNDSFNESQFQDKVLTPLSALSLKKDSQHFIFPKVEKAVTQSTFSNANAFENIEFATERNPNATIWRRAGLSLYERDSNTVGGRFNPGSGPRLIETLWNNNHAWLDDKFIYAFLCYIAIKSTRNVVVVDSLYTDPQNNLQHHSFLNGCYNYNQDVNADIIIMPIFFPAHWALIIFDVKKVPATMFIDSLPAENRWTDPDRDQLVKNFICQIRPSLRPELIQIQRIQRGSYTEQMDGINCGFFVCLYAESYLLEGHFLNEPVNINRERHRILWHVNELYKTDNVIHIPRKVPQPRAETFEQGLDKVIAEDNDINVQPFNFFDDEEEKVELSLAQKVQAIKSQKIITYSKDPKLDISSDSMEIDAGECNVQNPAPRRSKRILARKASSSSEKSEKEVQIKKSKKDTSVLPVTQRCHLKHKDINCASMKSGHLPDYYDSGKIGDKVCQHCRNKLLTGDKKCWSCYDGRVELPPFKEYPPEYKRLVTGKSADSKNFIRNENKYNSLFAFASVSAGREKCNPGGPMPVLLNGEFHRQIGSMLAGDNQVPSFDQLYIMDSDKANDYRLNNPVIENLPKKDPHLFYVLDKLIRANHPMSGILTNSYEFYQELEQNYPDQLNNFRIILVEDKNAPDEIKDPRLHRRQVNLPTKDESTVFAIWSSSTDEPPPLKGIWVTKKGQLTELWKHHPMNDSLLYPCLFPCGDDGYNLNIPYKKPATKKQKVSLHMDDNISIHSDDDMSESDTASIAESNAESEDQYGDEPSSKRNKLSIRAYIRYRLGIRSPENDEYHHIWSAGGGLNQKYLLDYAARIDDQVFNFLRRPDMDLRSELPDNMLEYLAKSAGLNSQHDIGRVIMFRANMPGFRPYFKEKYSDGCTIMNRARKRGCAMFMLTFTTNPKWPEMKGELYNNGQQLVDRPDIAVRYFADKVQEIHKDLEKNVFGKELAYAESTELQKRGWPHFHRIMATDIQAIPEIIEGYIWAHIPNPGDPSDQSEKAQQMRKLRELVIKYQLHDCRDDLCGPKYANGKCQKHFPRDYSDRVILHEDRPAVYWRPSPEDGGEVVQVKKGNIIKEYTNAHVTPYSPYFLLKYQTHHNVEFCYGERTNMKYAMKYPFKGACFANAKMQSGKVDFDEPAHYSQMYYRSACEAFLRIISFPYARLSHTIYHLPIHLPDQQPVYFRRIQTDEALNRVLAGNLPKTMLTEYWNQWASEQSIQFVNGKWSWEHDPEIKKILYEQMPEKYSYDKKAKAWKLRKIPKEIKKKKGIIGKITKPQPRNLELFALYVLLRHFPGDADTLKTFNGQLYPTFVEAARLHGLLSDDSVWERTLLEFSLDSNPKQMRNLFVQILIHGNASNARELWDKFIDHMFHPVRGNDPNDREHNRRIDIALAQIEILLSDYGKKNADYNLPEPSISISRDTDKALDRFFFGGEDDEPDQPIVQNTNTKLNADQQKVADTVDAALRADPSQSAIPRELFVTGDGGTGKTHLFNEIIKKGRREKIKVIACAYTGCAATLLFGGTTAHSVFRFGLDVDVDDTPSIPVQSFHGRRIRECKFILIDEVSMLPRNMLEAIDRICRQLAPPELKQYSFGGKVVVLSGDFKQSLPVVPQGSTRAQLNACIQASSLWQNFEKNILRLTINMRQGPGEREFTDWLRQVGDGRLGKQIEIPKSNIVHSRQELINFVLKNGAALSNPRDLIDGLILAPHNPTVDDINEQVLKMIQKPMKTYYSVDESTVDRPMDIDEAEREVEALNKLNPSGLPLHELQLKEGCVVVLLRNLCVSQGLVNGTRMIVTSPGVDIIKAEILTGSGAGSGTQVCLSKCWSQYEDKSPSQLSFKRLQFPIRLAHAMTIMKGQGQSASRVGVDLTCQVFAHGNLYTALSRVRSGKMYRIFAPHVPTDKDTGSKYVANVVAEGLNFLSQ